MDNLAGWLNLPLTLNLRQRDLLGDLLQTGVVIIAIVTVRLTTLAFVRRSTRLSEPLRLRLYVVVRRLTFVLLLLGLALVWTKQLQNLALSLVAIAVAIAIATKELILCLLGTVLRAASGSFGVGDRVEIGPWRGDVIDQTLLATTLLEVGPEYQRTGRAVVLPNSLLLHTPVINETFTDTYILHNIIVPMHLHDDWQSAEKRLLQVAEDVCRERIRAGSTQQREMERRHGLSALPVAPRVVLQMPEPGRIDLVLRVPTLAHDKGRTEQEILKRFFSRENKLEHAPVENPLPLPTTS